MALEFELILTRERVRGGKPEYDPLIDRFAARIDKASQSRLAGLGQGANQLLPDATRGGTRDPQDANCPGPWCGSDRRNGIASSRYRSRVGER